MNECGDERCMLWYPATYDNVSKQWIWYKEECAKTNTELLMEGVETGAVIAEAFEEPVTQALDAWCPEGGCFGQYGLEDPVSKDIAASTIDSTEDVLGVDLTGAKDVIYAENTADAWKAASSWFGSFTSGSKNSEMERKGSRDV